MRLRTSPAPFVFALVVVVGAASCSHGARSSTAPLAAAATSTTPSTPSATPWASPTTPPSPTPQPSPAPTFIPTRPPASTPPPAKPSPVVPPPSRGADHPASPAGLRIWSDGDSTSYFMSASFISMITAMGAIAVQPAPEYQISSGLLTPQRFDWAAFVTREMAARTPDVAVIMLGANDAYAGMPLDLYRRRVGELMDAMYAPARYVVWVGEPNMGRADLVAAIPAINRIFAEEASRRPWVTYVDTWLLTSDAAGRYQQYLPDAGGAPVQIRADDGVHFTPAGGRRLAYAVLTKFLGLR